MTKREYRDADKVKTVFDGASPMVTGETRHVKFAERILSLPAIDYGLDGLGEEEAAAVVRSWYERLENYLVDCNTYGQKIGNEGCYGYLGLTGAHIDRMMAKQEPFGSAAHMMFASRVKQICRIAREAYFQNGETPAQSALLYHSHHDGIVQQTQSIQITADFGGAAQTVEELAAKYLERLPVIESNENQAEKEKE